MLSRLLLTYILVRASGHPDFSSGIGMNELEVRSGWVEVKKKGRIRGGGCLVSKISGRKSIAGPLSVSSSVDKKPHCLLKGSEATASYCWVRFENSAVSPSLSVSRDSFNISLLALPVLLTATTRPARANEQLQRLIACDPRESCESLRVARRRSFSCVSAPIRLGCSSSSNTSTSTLSEQYYVPRALVGRAGCTAATASTAAATPFAGQRSPLPFANRYSGTGLLCEPGGEGSSWVLPSCK